MKKATQEGQCAKACFNCDWYDLASEICDLRDQEQKEFEYCRSWSERIDDEPCDANTCGF